jgi:hypothetical protein
MPPTVSILLPNLNNRGFLEERIETILDQSISDWELIVVDNFSEDGAWEYFQTLPSMDNRIKISQAPREGLYANWNNCLRKATGKYIYIATSDDTMADDCLEKLVRGLEGHPECDLAHCRVRLIDRQGNDAYDWWSSSSVFAASAGALLDQEHVRVAPYDGLLHLSGCTIYTSITQLLIRRSLFDRIGWFEPRGGSIGDFNWCRRASLASSTLHVPNTWGGWRVYSEQATAAAGVGSTDHSAKMEQMIDDALRRSVSQLNPEVRRQLEAGWQKASRELRELNRAVATRPKARDRWPLLLRQVTVRPHAVFQYVKSHFAPHPSWPLSMADIARGWLASAGFDSVLQPTGEARQPIRKSAVGRVSNLHES